MKYTEAFWALNPGKPVSGYVYERRMLRDYHNRVSLYFLNDRAVIQVFYFKTYIYVSGRLGHANDDVYIRPWQGRG